MKLFYTALFALLCLAFPVSAEAQAPTAIAPVPTEYQLKLMQMEVYAFIHFGPNTFNNQEWGYGDAAPSVFNPDTLDCEQWVRTLKNGGMQGVIFTAKHHDGFCLWPSKFTDYTIRYSPYRGGYGDAVGELESACKRLGLKLGIYLSPWDRHKGIYGDDGYVRYYKNQLKELLLSYDDIFEFWFDGANGGDGYYGGARETRTIDRQTYYHFDELFSTIQQLQPQVVIHSDGGPGNRWVGNEDGVAGETNWAFLTDAHAVPAGVENYETVLSQGDADGNNFIPAECDVSIRRPYWFWSTTNESSLLSADDLVDLYYKSVGRNATLLLNVPVNIHGRISSADSTNLAKFHDIIAETFSDNLLQGATVQASNTRGSGFEADNVISSDYDSYWATADGTTTGTLTFTLPAAREFNTVMLQEYLPLGQRVRSFKVEYLNNGTWTAIPTTDAMTTIGYKRLLRLSSTVSTTSVRVTFTDARGPLCINQIGIFLAK